MQWQTIQQSESAGWPDTPSALIPADGIKREVHIYSCDGLCHCRGEVDLHPYHAVVHWNSEEK